MYTLIENARIISPDLDIDNGSVLIKDDLICFEMLQNLCCLAWKPVLTLVFSFRNVIETVH